MLPYRTGDFFIMAYVDPTKYVRYNVRLSQAEFSSLQCVKTENGIPDISKAIRYCIEQEANRIRTKHAAKVNQEGGTHE